jgi:hypothetical protein
MKCPLSFLFSKLVTRQVIETIFSFAVFVEIATYMQVVKAE